MRNFVLIAILAAATCSFVARGESETPLTSLPYTPGLDLGAMDKAADPCTDFYQYSCGGWRSKNPIPADQSSWSVYGKLSQDNQRFLWGILQNLAEPKATDSVNQRKIGDFFAACMAEPAIEKAKAGPAVKFTDTIDKMRSTAEIPGVVGQLHAQVPYAGMFFNFDAAQDFGDSTSVIAAVGAGGLGLPDRDYYVKTDPKSKELRAKYVRHIQKIFILSGDDEQRSLAEANAVMSIETSLAKQTLTKVERRDPYKLYHKVDGRGLAVMTPHFKWTEYFAKAQSSDTTPFTKFNVSEPKFLRGLDQLLSKAKLADLKTYLRWHVLHSMAPLMSTEYVNENFDFYSKTLRGTQELPPRWKRCVRLVDQNLGEALGQEFVSRVFSPALKAKALHMTEQVEKAMRNDINQLSWMKPQTKAKAAEKLDTIVNKIGYPDRWRDYSALSIDRANFAANVEHGYQFEFQRRLKKIGKPLDRSEWDMTPPTVNAYYDAQMNDINFPAGVLQPPLYDAKMDDAPNYGNTGGTIGHELTHAFDDEGRQFDAKGNLKDWWTKEDAKGFETRAACVVDQYKNYTVVDELKINSKLTEGEDIADLGGLILGWAAWKAEEDGKTLEPIDGLTPDQRFFVGYAQWACENDRPEELRVRALTNEHSPGKYRVNGLVVNMPEFQKAFSCKDDQPMVQKNRCRVW